MTHDEHSEHDDEGYRGAATLRLEDERVFDVQVVLRGHVEPLDGRYHWYGRVAVHAELESALGGKRTRALVVTPQGEAVGDLSDVDPWGRYRVSGTSTPPFAVVTDVTDVTDAAEVPA
ncbi:DUF4873 domain-containing protein [Actinomycetospora sp. OC33-EN08]|uniref:DUF4873 domain-containing protein n=1 Tax=Actinomycetospora aurantiaca TaxID=3129233 RepID=A0ABU8MIX1_9PSEU